MNKPDMKKLILLNLPYVFAFYFADKIAAVFRLAPGTEFIDKLTNGFAVFGTAFANPLPSFHPVDLLVGVMLVRCSSWRSTSRAKPQEVPAGRRVRLCPMGQAGGHQAVHGSGVLEQRHLTQTEFLTMNSRPKQPKYARNKNPCHRRFRLR